MNVLTDLINILDDILTNPTVVLIGATTLIQVAPIQFNPWSKILSWISEAINGDIRRDVTLLVQCQEELKHDFEESKAQEKRWHILEFANSCRKGEKHDKEEWDHVITDLEDYEKYIAAKGLTNGVIGENTKYLRELYHERLKDDDFS